MVGLATEGHVPLIRPQTQSSRGLSSNGRALASHARGKGIDAPSLQSFFGRFLPLACAGVLGVVVGLPRLAVVGRVHALLRDFFGGVFRGVCFYCFSKCLNEFGITFVTSK